MLRAERTYLVSGPAAPNCCQATSPRPSRSNATNTGSLSGAVLGTCDEEVGQEVRLAGRHPLLQEGGHLLWRGEHGVVDTAQHLVGYARLPTRLGRHQVSDLLPIRLGLLLILSCWVCSAEVQC